MSTTIGSMPCLPILSASAARLGADGGGYGLGEGASALGGGSEDDEVYAVVSGEVHDQGTGVVGLDGVEREAARGVAEGSGPESESHEVFERWAPGGITVVAAHAG